MKHTSAGEAFTELVLTVFRLNGLLLEAGDRLTEPVGQTSARWQVMGCIDDEARSVSEIARIMGLTRQSVQRIADLLVKDGLAIYEANPAHKRAKLLKLNARGLKTLRTIEKAQCTWANALGKTLGIGDLTKVSEVLERLLTVLARK